MVVKSLDVIIVIKSAWRGPRSVLCLAQRARVTARAPDDVDLAQDTARIGPRDTGV